MGRYIVAQETATGAIEVFDGACNEFILRGRGVDLAAIKRLVEMANKGETYATADEQLGVTELEAGTSEILLGIPFDELAIVVETPDKD